MNKHTGGSSAPLAKSPIIRRIREKDSADRIDERIPPSGNTRFIISADIAAEISSEKSVPMPISEEGFSGRSSRMDVTTNTANTVIKLISVLNSRILPFPFSF